MSPKYFFILLISVLLYSSCEKANVLHPNMVNLGLPEITSFSPVTAKPFETVIVTGNNFGDEPANIKVMIGDMEGYVLLHTMHELRFMTPLTSLTASYNIVLTVNGKTTTSSDKLTIITPWALRTSYPAGNNSTAGLHLINIDGSAYALNADNSVVGVYKTSMMRYDHDADTWIAEATLENGIFSNPMSFSIGKKAYIGAGYSPYVEGTLNEFWAYDAETNTWTRKADYPGEYKKDAFGFTSGGKGYLAGGQGLSYEYLNQLWVYDPAGNTWTQKNDVPFYITNVFEMEGLSFFTDFSGNIYKYDSAGDSFTKISSTDKLVLFQGFALNGYLYFLEDNLNTGAWRLNCTDFTWSSWEDPCPITQDSKFLSLDTIGYAVDVNVHPGYFYSFTPQE